MLSDREEKGTDKNPDISNTEESIKLGATSHLFWYLLFTN